MEAWAEGALDEGLVVEVAGLDGWVVEACARG